MNYTSEKLLKKCWPHQQSKISHKGRKNKFLFCHLRYARPLDFSRFLHSWLNLALGYHNYRARICDKEQGLVRLRDSLGTGADHSRCRWVNQGHIHSLTAILGTDDLCHPFWPGLAQQLPCKEEREREREKNHQETGPKEWDLFTQRNTALSRWGREAEGQ